jgi:hypothetical protein
MERFDKFSVFARVARRTVFVLTLLDSKTAAALVTNHDTIDESLEHLLQTFETRQASTNAVDEHGWGFAITLAVQRIPTASPLWARWWALEPCPAAIWTQAFNATTTRLPRVMCLDAPYMWKDLEVVKACLDKPRLIHLRGRLRIATSVEAQIAEKLDAFVLARWTPLRAAWVAIALCGAWCQ